MRKIEGDLLPAQADGFTLRSVGGSNRAGRALVGQLVGLAGVGAAHQGGFRHALRASRESLEKRYKQRTETKQITQYISVLSRLDIRTRIDNTIRIYQIVVEN